VGRRPGPGDVTNHHMIAVHEPMGVRLVAVRHSYKGTGPWGH
jgi:hypothetical protein